MTIVVDANIAIAVLDPDHRFHRAALRRCLEAERVAILNVTRAEALIHPMRLGKFEQADDALDRLGFHTDVVDNLVADGARRLRATYGNKNFPIVDALVVAFGVEYDWPVVTCDAKWPLVDEATIETLTNRG